MAKTWTLAEIRSEVRKITGRQSTSDVSNSTLNEDINTFYMDKFPLAVHLPELVGFYSFTTSEDDEDYDLPTTVLDIFQPVTINYGDGEGDQELAYWRDPDAFFHAFPEGEGSGTAQTTTQTLGTGDGSTALFSATLNVSYVVPSSVSVTDGTETFTDDGAGTLTGSLGGTGTIAYSTGVISVTFNSNVTDGQAVTASFQYTGADRPQYMLLYGRTLYMRPVPDDSYTVKVGAYQKPSELTSDSSAVTNPRWGPAIAYGTALEMLFAVKDMEAVAQISPVYRFHLNQINRLDLLPKSGLRGKPCF